MAQDEIGVGIIGTGFGVRVQLPLWQHTPAPASRPCAATARCTGARSPVPSERRFQGYEEEKVVQPISGDLDDRLRSLAGRVHQRLDKISGEESTKNALAMPFINDVLKYNVFDPDDVVPEYVADVGVKKGERVDYCLFQNGVPAIIVECKAYGADLSKESITQLHRYFHNTEARFGILTDGVVYKFFTDLDKDNKMDDSPFFDFNILDYRDMDIEVLKQFCKDAFDTSEIRTRARDLKIARDIKAALEQEIDEPSPEFAKFLIGRTGFGSRSAKAIERFQRIAKGAFHSMIEEKMQARLESALRATKLKQRDEPEESPASAPASTAKEIDTTEEETLAFAIVREIAGQHVSQDLIDTYDTKNYHVVFLRSPHNLLTRTICRLYLKNPDYKRISFPVLGNSGSPPEYKIVPIQSIEDIHDHAERLQEIVTQCQQAGWWFAGSGTKEDKDEANA